MTTTITAAADPSSPSHLSIILSSYKSLDLPSLQSHLIALTTPLTSLQTSSLQSRKKLAEETRAWKKLDGDQAKIDGVKPLLKLYQAEVDELTKRAREAEGGVQRVEERLRGVEDPYAVLERLIDQTASLTDLESLRAQASQLRSDNASLQSQLTTQARAEEERNRASSSRISQLESRLAETRSSVEAELRARYEERLDNANAREEELRKQLEGMRASNEAAQKKLASAASEDVAAAAAASSRSGGGGASAAEVEMLAADLQRAQQRVAAVERRNEQLREEVEKVKGGANGGGGGVDKEQVIELERRLADEQGARARLQAELDGSAEQRRTALTALEDNLAQSQKALRERSDEITTLRSKLDSMADYGEVKRELEIMRIVEFSSGLEDDDDDDDNIELKQTKAKPLEALLMEKNKKLQDDLATLRVKHHELETATAGSTCDLGGLREEVERLKALNERLEADLMAAVGGEGSSKNPASTPAARQAAKGRAAQSAEEALEEMGRIEKGEVDFKTPAQTNGHSGASSTAAAGPSPSSEASRSSPTLPKATPAAASSSSSDVLPIIVSQRDRFRARNAELEEELRRQFDVVTQLRSDIKGLQADNLALYEKVRYLQSYGGGGAGPSSSAVGVAAARTDSASAYPPASSGRSRAQEHRGVPSTIASGSSLHPEDKYRRRYEASMNPFEAFRGREQRSALARLNPLERILHAFATMLVAHRRARIGAVIYAAGMHLLVFFVMVEYTFSAGGARGGGGLAGATCAMPVGGGGGGGAAPMEPAGMGRP